MKRASPQPSPSVGAAVLEELGIPFADFRLRALPGACSNFTHLLETVAEGKPPRKIVIRRYKPANYETGHDKPRCEFHALRMLQARELPAPKPLLLDATGEILGLPGILTEFVDGAAIPLPQEAWRWGQMAEKAAQTLAKIHHVPVDEADKPCLMDDNVEVAWFIKDGVVPDFMRSDQDGERVWHVVKARWGSWAPAEPRFAHTDYWSGNILWRAGEIAAVLDWEEAGYGHPAADVAYARMGYCIEGIPEAADVFLRAYEAAAGWRLNRAELALFELAASARPMMSPSEWFARPYMETGFRKFIAGAIARLDAEAG